MEKIIKAGFYGSWYEVAQGFNDELRLKFYDAILDYYFTRKEPDPDSPVIPFFTLIKPSIDKDIKDKVNGAIGGHNKGGITKKNTPLEEIKYPPLQEKNSKVNVKDKDNEKVNVKVKEGDFDTNFLNIIKTLTTEHGVKISATVKIAMRDRLTENNLDADFLLYCYEVTKTKYQNATPVELASLFVSSVLSWDNLVKSYKQKIKKEKKSESRKKDSTTPPPETCSYCGTTLELGAMENSVECPHCREQGMRTFWELVNGNWICNR